MEEQASTQAVTRGQRVFTCGHSFHYWVAPLLAELARSAGISGHQSVGVSSIGGSRAIQHWDVPDEQNHAKRALRAGGVDVLTLACMTWPDEGIRHFAKLAAAHNTDARVTLQELWLPEDRFPFDAANRTRQSVEQFNDTTMDDLKKPHAEYFRVMEDYARGVNAEIGRRVVHIVPDAQATLSLRERIIAGSAPGLKRQSDLFTDAWGHPQPPLQLLSAYCHFAVIYRRNPEGLPIPASFKEQWRWDAALTPMLRELAWNAVSNHPMSGVTPTGR